MDLIMILLLANTAISFILAILLFLASRKRRVRRFYDVNDDIQSIKEQII